MVRPTMTLEPRRGDGGGAMLTECPFCEAPIPETDSFVYHWPKCPANASGSDGVDA